MKGVCENPECQRPIEWTHKPRKYCQPACRKKMSRERKAQKEKEQLFARWRCLHLCQYTIEILKTLLVKDGLRATRLATDALEAELWEGR
jgi:hypothetical protein